MHDSQNSDTGMGAGYASPRGEGLLHSGVSSSQRGNEAHDYSGEMNGSGFSPPRTIGGGWSRDQHTGGIRESRDRLRHIPSRGQETPRGLSRTDE